jgi:hypothetical protein
MLSLGHEGDDIYGISRMNHWFRVALLCALIPLVVGVAVFVGWVWTRALWLMISGYYVIVVGIVLFLAGLIALWNGVRSAKQAQIRYGRPAAVTLALLIANFPIAFVLSAYAFNLMTSNDIVFVNNSAEAARDIVLTDPSGAQYQVPNIAAHETRRKAIHFHGDGAVTYRMTIGTADMTGTLLGYTTDGVGSRVHVEIAADRTIDVKVTTPIPEYD